jgi:hypothetical protein
LGVDTSGEGKTHSVSGSRSSERAPDFILQQRIYEVESARRETKLFWVAVMSALFSFVSAATAIFAVVSHHA